jgi:hypothetical protein
MKLINGMFGPGNVLENSWNFVRVIVWEACNSLQVSIMVTEFIMNLLNGIH